MLVKLAYLASGLLVGALVGYQLHGGYTDGKLDACRDMSRIINSMIPVSLQCAKESGDVVIYSELDPFKKFNLDGTLRK